MGSCAVPKQQQKKEEIIRLPLNSEHDGSKDEKSPTNDQAQNILYSEGENFQEQIMHDSSIHLQYNSLKSSEKKIFVNLLWKQQNSFSNYEQQEPKEDQPCDGHVKIYLDNYAMYEGNMQNRMFNGFGRLVELNGNSYTGEWKNNLKHGYGLEIIKGQQEYQGSFVEGKKCGNGVMKYADSSYYDGEFQANQLCGVGKFVDKNGVQYSGTWKSNKLNGKGKIVWPDQQEYEGDFVDGKKNGYGIFKWKTGKIYQGEWKDGMQHGKGELTKKNGVTKKVEYVEGKLVDTKHSSKSKIGSSQFLSKSSNHQLGNLKSGIQIKY